MMREEKTPMVRTRRACLRQFGALSLLALPRTTRQIPAPAALLVLLEHCEGRALASLPGWSRWTASGTLLSPVREIDGARHCTALLAGSEASHQLLTEVLLETGNTVALVSSGAAATLEELAREPARPVRISCAALQTAAPVADNKDEVLLAALRAAGLEVPAVRSALLQRRILRRGLLPVDNADDAHLLTATSVALELARELPATLTVLRLSVSAGDTRFATTMNRAITQLLEGATNNLSVVIACLPALPVPEKQEPQRAAAFLFGQRFKQGFAVRSGAALLDLAPLLAHLLGVKLPEARGKLLRSVLS